MSGASSPIDPDSATGFITEHYVGYTPQRNGRTVSYDVSHARWNAWPASDANLSCDVGMVYGPEWREVLESPPASAFVCDGAPVSISFPRLLPT